MKSFCNIFIIITIVTIFIIDTFVLQNVFGIWWFRSCGNSHDDVIKWKHFPRNWPFLRGIHRSPVNSPHKGQWRGALMFSLVCVWINDWVNNREAGDLRRYRAQYDVSLMVAKKNEISCNFTELPENLLRRSLLRNEPVNKWSVMFTHYGLVIQRGDRDLCQR